MINLPALPQRTFAEFFAGVGLMRVGLERAGWKIAFANDICEDKYEMYAAHFEDADDHFVVEDIHKLSANEVPTVTLATASFPCNDLSLAGARAGLKGRQSSAFYGFVRILREPKNALTMQYSALLSTEGVELQFSDDAVREIAHYAAVVNERTENIGARRLHTILERLLDELSFEASDMRGQKSIIDAAYVQRVLADIIKDEDLSRYVL